jgi:phage baseplate assembly protein W
MKIFKNIFSDIPMFFSENKFNRDLEIKKDHIAIKESIKNIILTLFNERPFDPEFGTNVTTGLFENPTDFSFYVENSIGTALVRYEPRIRLLSLNTSFSGRTLSVDIKYELVQTKNIENLTIVANIVK